MGGKRKADDEGKGKEDKSVEVGPGMQSLIEICESLEGITVEEALAEHSDVDVDDDEALMDTLLLPFACPIPARSRAPKYR